MVESLLCIPLMYDSYFGEIGKGSIWKPFKTKLFKNINSFLSKVLMYDAQYMGKLGSKYQL